MAAAKQGKFTVISADEVRAVKRGRKAVIDPTLVEAMEALDGPGLAVNLGSVFGAIPSGDSRRQSVANTIRKHFRHVHGEAPELSIPWTPEGEPQAVRKS